MRKNIEAVLVLLKKQRDVYNRMLEFSHQQKANISDTNIVNELLLKKAELVKEIEKTDAQLAEFKLRWNEDRSVFSAEEQSAISGVFDEIGAILKELLAVEQECIDLAKGLQQGRSREMGKVSVGKKALGLYSSSRKGPINPSSKFMDKRG